MAKYVGIAVIPYNDIGLDASGNLRMVHDAEAVGQHARQRISFFKGEWFLDPEIGVDWFGQVMGHRPDRISIGEALVKRVILSTPGVTGMIEISTRYDAASRGMIVDKAEVETEFDEIVTV